jgi:surfeit locus 1 family protein
VNASEQRRGPLVPGLVALAGFVVLIVLGTWQIERKAWKEALIAALRQRVTAEPVALPPQESWGRLTAENSEFLRVRVRIDFRKEGDALLYTSGSALRNDVKSPGYFVFTPVRLSGGTLIVVNRGYIPDFSYPGRAGSEEIVGYLRWPERSSWFIADHDNSNATVWYVRDHRLMAQVKRWGEVGPFYIEQESPAPPGGLPHPAALKVELRNEHLQYALTWYGLAAVLVVVFTIWARGRRRAAEINP